MFDSQTERHLVKSARRRRRMRARVAVGAGLGLLVAVSKALGIAISVPSRRFRPRGADSAIKRQTKAALGHERLRPA